jgi:LysM domain
VIHLFPLGLLCAPSPQPRNPARRGSLGFALGMGLLAILTVPAAALAQPTGGAAPLGASVDAVGPAEAVATTPTPGVGALPQYGGGSKAAAPTGPLGGGNTTGSSSRGLSGPNDRDGFDLYKGNAPGTTYRGSSGGGFIPPSGSLSLGGAVGGDVHTVKRGDTLWDICDSHLQNPYQWPRIWALNPQIRNPHWLYPGDQVKLREGATATATATAASPGRLNDGRKRVVPNSIFLRNEAYIENESDAVWGEISGSREDKMFLENFDEVYVQVAGNRELRVGQELTIFRPQRDSSSGKVVQIQGALRVDTWNAASHVARCRVIETLDTIERGARVGPLQRVFEVVPPARNEAEVRTSVVTTAGAYAFSGQHQLVFIGAGSRLGVKPGNRAMVLRRGDAWHATRPTPAAALRIAMESDEAGATEAVAKPKDLSALPEEVVAELRVVSVREDSSLCIVTDARREIELYDDVYIRKGY